MTTGAKLVGLAVAGMVGTLARYWLGGVVQRASGGVFPWGTFAVNTLGCFLFGLVFTLAEERLLISGDTRFVLLTGFMGAFTTFSTYAFETGAMLRDAQWLGAGANAVAHNLGGLVCLFLGIAAGRTL